MIKKSLLISLVPAIALIYSFIIPVGPPELSYEQKLLKYMISALGQVHYSPVEFTDELSEELFEEYLDNLDPNKRFFTENQIIQLSRYSDRLDNQILNLDLEFYNLSVDLFGKNLERSKKIYTDVLQKDIEFSTSEIYDAEPDDDEWPQDSTELYEKWRKLIKYEMLIRYNNGLKKVLIDTTVNEEDYLQSLKLMESDTLLEQARKKVKKSFDTYFENFTQYTDKELYDTYLNSIANIYDPHSSYFKPKDKADFNMRMSNQLEGIGARLSSDGSYTKVVEIVPGGPAWKQGELKAEDLILKVAQEDEEPVDIVGMSVNDVVQLIRGDKGTKVTLTVRHPDNSMEDITIKRDVIIFEEGYARSVLLRHEGGEYIIGYTALPSFYTDFARTGARNSSEDIKTELEKFKNSNVNGVILDLRNNGGGSLNDAVKMGGFFIEEGPIVQVKSRDSKPYVLEDEDEEVVFDKPLVILINHSSASASEIVAAALKDYKRALIVGTDPTFGKGTVQRFYKLNRLLPRGERKNNELGEVKITVQKFYRINGESTQLRGLYPDITLPSLYSAEEYGERSYPHSLPYDVIAAQDYDQDVYQISDIDILRQKSLSRVEKNSVFNKIEKRAEQIEERRKLTEYPLELSSYREWIERLDAENKTYKDLFTPNEHLEITILPEDIEYMGTDSIRIDRHDKFIKNVKKDIYIEESLNIMYDILATDLTRKD